MDLTLRFSAHPSEEVLEAYALKRLPEDQTPEVEMHLLACEACQNTLADLDTFIASMKAVAPEAAPVRVPGRVRTERPSRFPRWQVALATSALLVGVFLLWDSGKTAPRATIILFSMRGGEIAPPTGPANVPLELRIASTQMDKREGFRIDVVTSTGELSWSGPVTRSVERGPLALVDKRLSAGSYWVRLYSPEKQLLQEYGLRLN